MELPRGMLVSPSVREYALCCKVCVTAFQMRCALVFVFLFFVFFKKMIIKEARKKKQPSISETFLKAVKLLSFYWQFPTGTGYIRCNCHLRFNEQSYKKKAKRKIRCVNCN